MKNIVYTDSANQKLATLHKEFDIKIEQYFRESKYSLGDEFIEVTASDIDEITNRIRIIKPNRQLFSRDLMVYMSIVVGTITTIVGFIYPYLTSFLENITSTQLFIILYGLSLTILGILYLFLNKIKRNKEKELFRSTFDEKIHREFF